jgi:hypothetical protein
MNRPYFNIIDTVYVTCSVCNHDILYTANAIAAHEKRCIVSDEFKESAAQNSGRMIAPPPPPSRT